MLIKMSEMKPETIYRIVGPTNIDDGRLVVIHEITPEDDLRIRTIDQPYNAKGWYINPKNECYIEVEEVLSLHTITDTCTKR